MSLVLSGGGRFDTEPCESCTRPGCSFDGAWFHLRLILTGFDGHHDAPVFAPHTLESCRAYREGLRVIRESLERAS